MDKPVLSEDSQVNAADKHQPHVMENYKFPLQKWIGRQVISESRLAVLVPEWISPLKKAGLSTSTELSHFFQDRGAPPQKAQRRALEIWSGNIFEADQGQLTFTKDAQLLIAVAKINASAESVAWEGTATKTNIPLKRKESRHHRHTSSLHIKFSPLSDIAPQFVRALFDADLVTKGSLYAAIRRQSASDALAYVHINRLWNGDIFDKRAQQPSLLPFVKNLAKAIDFDAESLITAQQASAPNIVSNDVTTRHPSTRKPLQRGRKSAALKTYPVWSITAPPLLERLEEKGLVTRSQLLVALMGAGIGKNQAQLSLAAFLKGKISRGKFNRKPSAVAKRIADLAGLRLEEAYPVLGVNAQKADQSPIIKATSDATGRRGRISAQLKDFPLFQSHPQLLVELKKKNILTRTDLTRSVIGHVQSQEERTLPFISVYGATTKILSGQIIGKQKHPPVLSSIARRLADVAGLSYDVAYPGFGEDGVKPETQNKKMPAQRGRQSKALKDHAVWADTSPLLLTRLEGQGIVTRKQLIDALMDPSTRQDAIENGVSSFLNGKIGKGKNGRIPTFTAKRIADHAGLSIQEAYPKIAAPTEKSQPSQGNSTSLGTFVLLQNNPILKQRLEERKILTRAQLIRAVMERRRNVEGKDFKYEVLHITISALLNGKISNDQKKHPTLSKAACVVADIAELPYAIAYPAWARAVKAAGTQDKIIKTRKGSVENPRIKRVKPVSMPTFSEKVPFEEKDAFHRANQSRRVLLEGFCKIPSTLQIMREWYAEMALGKRPAIVPTHSPSLLVDKAGDDKDVMKQYGVIADMLKRHVASQQAAPPPPGVDRTAFCTQASRSISESFGQTVRCFESH